MITYEVSSAVARFFDAGLGPSHDELTRLIRRSGLQASDPRQHDDVVGKMKRVRDVLTAAISIDAAAASSLMQSLLGAMRACGCFRPGADNYAGAETVAAAQEAFRREGFDLDDEGNLRPLVLDSLRGEDLTHALWSHVRRARVNASDAPLVLGTAKDLLEAVARHVLVETTGSYPPTQSVPMTLFQAFDRVGLSTPSLGLIDQLDQDPRRALHQVICLLGIAVNRLRNQMGTGHGRPHAPDATEVDSQLSALGTAIASQLLLEALRAQRGSRVVGASSSDTVNFGGVKA